MSFLKTKLDDITARTEAYSKHVNDYKAIAAFMNSRIADMRLTTNQQAILDRYQFIYNQIVSGKYTERAIKLQLVELHHISPVQAQKDILNTKELFGTGVNIEKQFAIRIDLERLDISIRKAMETNNMDAHAKLQRAKTDLLKLLPEQDKRMIDEFIIPNVIAQFNPELMGVPPTTPAEMDKLLQKLKKEYNFKEDLGFIVDIPHEDIATDGAAE